MRSFYFIRILMILSGWCLILTFPAFSQINLTKNPLKPEECDPPKMMTDKFGQTRPAVMYSKDENGVCRSRMLFDPNESQAMMSMAGDGQQGIQTQADYFDLAAYWAPIWYQDVDDSNTRAEYITNVNYDGDWIANNNWENLNNYPLLGYIYYSVIETTTHWFIVYGDFHPRDWGAGLDPDHENDFEGAQFVIRKDGSQYGELVLVSTQAHDNLTMYSEHPDVMAGSKSVSGDVPMDGSHVKLFVEAEVHGVKISPSRTGNDGPFNSGVNFPGGDGVVYRYTGIAEEPVGDNDRDVGYALLPLEGELWAKRTGFWPNLYAEWFNYNGVRYSLAGAIPGAFRGDNGGDNKAKPAWPWDDGSDGNVNKGDWAIDPAWAFSQHATISHDYSLDYINNFYLDVSEVGPILSVVSDNASQYFSLFYLGPVGGDRDCEENDYNKWCFESGTPHWPNSMIGCYEISDNNNNSDDRDCVYDSNHSNIIQYLWNDQSYDYHTNNIDHIEIQTMTRRNVCSGLTGEDDDGWEYKPESDYVLTLNLSPSNAWVDQYCEDGSLINGHGGPLRVSALFDGDGVYYGLEVRAGDHKDEGAFEIINVDVVLKPVFCSDRTLTGSCNAQRKYCDENLDLVNNCSVCGCPFGYGCAADGSCRRSGSCFLAGTSISMADGTVRPIEKIQVGDLVLSADEAGNVSSNKVMNLFTHPETKGYLVIKTKDGIELKVTAEHMVYSGDSYKAAGDLKVGSSLMILRDGELVKVQIGDMQKIDSVETVYNFEVEDDHTYFANNVLVHNRKAYEVTIPQP